MSPSSSDVFDDGAVFESEQDAWSPLPSASFALADGGVDASVPSFGARYAMGVGEDSGLVYLFGGVSAEGEVLDDGAILDVRGGGWFAMSHHGAPSPRSAPTLVALDAARLMVFGGRTGFGGAAVGGKVYEVNTGVWTSLPPAPIGDRQEHTAVMDPLGHRVIVWGGRSGDGDSPRASGARYDIATNTWSTMAEAPIRRAGHFAVWSAHAKRMLVLFGRDGSWPGHRGDGAAYDPESDFWTWLPDISSTGLVPHDGVAVFSAAGAVWVVGETRAARLDVEANVWASVPDPSQHGAYLRGWFASDAHSTRGRPVVWGILGGEELRGYANRTLELGH